MCDARSRQLCSLCSNETYGVAVGDDASIAGPVRPALAVLTLVPIDARNFFTIASNNGIRSGEFTDRQPMDTDRPMLERPSTLMFVGVGWGPANNRDSSVMPACWHRFRRELHGRRHLIGERLCG